MTLIEIRPHLIADTARCGALERLQSYYDSTQYDGRPDFFTGLYPNGKGHPVPLRHRAPCVVYPLPKACVKHVARFTYGEGRFPKIHAEGLSDEDNKTLTAAIVEYVKAARLRRAGQAHLTQGLSLGTGLAIMSLRNGRFSWEVGDPAHSWAAFEDGNPDNPVLELVTCYQFDKLIDDPNLGIRYERHWYRCDVTDTAFIEYEPVPVIEGRPPEWRGAKETPHGFGFCPVLWTRNNAEESCGGLDGVSLYDGLFDEFDALNFALSQRHRGVHYLGVPQPYETGVEEDDGPQKDTAYGGNSTPGYQSAEGSHGTALSGKRRSGPAEVWSYQSDKVKLGLLETTGKAFEVASLHVSDIRSRVLESMSVVMANVADVAGGNREMSGKFLALAYAPMLALVDEIREEWWARSLEPMLHMMFRATVSLGPEVTIEGAEDVSRIVGAAKTLPKLSPTWGDYFSPSNAEIKEGVETAAMASEKGLVTGEAATRYVAPYFGVEDVDAERADIDAKAEEEAQKAVEMMQQTKASGPEPGAPPKEVKP